MLFSSHEKAHGSPHKYFNESIDLLYRQGYQAAIGNSIAILFVGLVYVFSQPYLLTSIWLLCSVSLVILRVWLIHSYQQPSQDTLSQQQWFNLYWLSIVVSGCLWGSLTFLPNLQDSVYLYLLSLLTLAYVSTGAMSSLGVSLIVYGSFLIMILLVSSIGILMGASDKQAVIIIVAQILLMIVLFLRAKEHRNTLIMLLDQRKEAEKLSRRLQAKQKVIKQDQIIARQVYDRITSASSRQFDNFCYISRSLHEFSGDIIQWSQDKDQNQYIMLCDFTGHGLPAAMGAVPASGIFQAMTEKSMPLSRIATELNKKLCCLLPTEFFACVILVKLSPQNQLEVINAGLPSGYIVNTGGQVEHSFKAEHLPFGITTMEEQDFVVWSSTIKPGDSVFFCSDGILEAENEQNQQWDENMLMECFKTYSGKAICEQIEQELDVFMGSETPHDDLSLVQLIAHS
ncbi:MAG: PP2C family protein-serine/threonine phosphatase [bacterium]